nr:SRPBCC domain-containing protein [Microbacterium bovistercoris]
MPDITRILDIAAPPSRVWAQFAEPAGMRSWLADDLDIDLQRGGEYRMTGPDGTTITGTVLEIVPEGRLVLSWCEQDAGWRHPARLVFLLEAVTTGTRVTLRHDGFAGIGSPRWAAIEQAYVRGLAEHPVLEALAAAVGADVA